MKGEEGCTGGGRQGLFYFSGLRALRLPKGLSPLPWWPHPRPRCQVSVAKHFLVPVRPGRRSYAQCLGSCSGGRGPEGRCRNCLPPSSPALALSYLADERSRRLRRAPGRPACPLIVRRRRALAPRSPWTKSIAPISLSSRMSRASTG